MHLNVLSIDDKDFYEALYRLRDNSYARKVFATLFEEQARIAGNMAKTKDEALLRWMQGAYQVLEDIHNIAWGDKD